MSCPVNQENLTQLKQFVSFVKLQPGILHLPQLKFFKEFIESFGGKIPGQEKMDFNESKADEVPQEGAHVEENNESEPESEPELDMSGCIEPDIIDETQKMGDPSKEVTEEDSDKADELRTQAMAEFSNANLEKAIQLFTEAIEINPTSALLFAKRGQTYLKWGKPNACIKDTTKALELNPDSAIAYKFRGRSYRLLGKFDLAAKDLRQACKIDFDEQVDEWLKEVTPNAKKIEEHALKIERKRKDKEEKERLERIRKSKAAHAEAAANFGSAQSNQRAKSNLPPDGAPNAGYPSDFFSAFADSPEFNELFKDPEVAEAIGAIASNPSDLYKYASNPKIAKIINQLTKNYAGGFGVPGFPGSNVPTPGRETKAPAPEAEPSKNKRVEPEEDDLD